MTKKEYFELVRQVGKFLRKEQIYYIRIYSEPRAHGFHRTKVWNIQGNLLELVELLHRKFGEHLLISPKPGYNGTAWGRSVVLYPRRPLQGE